MKRSEMVLNIASKLVHELTDFMRFDKAQEMTEIVLTRIEKDGMLPPRYLKKIHTYPELDDNGDYLGYDGEIEEYVYEWEPETNGLITKEEALELLNVPTGSPAGQLEMVMELYNPTGDKEDE